MEVRVLGGLEVRRDGEVLDLGPPRQRAVLAVLVLEAGRVVAADRLVELLWGDGAPKAAASLQAYVSKLRTVLEPDRRPREPARVLVSQPPGYRLDVARHDVDAFRFEDLVAEGRAHLRAGDHAAALAALDPTLALWAGPPLPELADERFAVDLVERLGRVRLTALETAAEARLALGDARGVVALLDAESVANPLREHLNCLLAVALYRLGRQVDALRLLERCRHALADTAGVGPGPELAALAADLLAHAPTLDGAPTPAPAGGPPAPADPPTVVTGPDLVGRRRELDALTGVLDAAGSRGGVAVLVGEPGIGKTRLAEELAAVAGRRGVVRAWARCPETGTAPPFWPLTRLAEQLREAGVDVDGPAPVTAGPGAHAVLAHATVEGLRATGRPVLLVVDDLQWADPDSLRLLEHVAGELPTTRTLLVVTTRPPTDAPDAVVDCLGELVRVPGALQLRVDGLGVDEVAAWFARRAKQAGGAGGDVPPEVAELVHGRTGGNPLFVKEVADLLAAEGRLADADAIRSGRAVPPGVQFVVRRRVSRLPVPSQQLLAVAAVVGPVVDAELVAAAVGCTTPEALDRLAPAVDAGLLVDDGTGLRFSHALVSDALADEVNAVRRAAIHATAARSLDARAGADPTAAAAVAHHALAGLLAGTGELAVEAGARAAATASTRHAHQDAATHWANVATALARTRPADVTARVEALVSQGGALLAADLVGAAKGPLVEAVGLAGDAGLVEPMARAAAHFDHAHVWSNEGYLVVDPDVVAALERTLAAVDADPTGAVPKPLRARVLAGLASELVFADAARHQAVGDAAVAAARAAGDPGTLARVLVDVELPNRADLLELRRERAAEVVALCADHDLPADVTFAGHHTLAYHALESADLDGVVAHHARAAQVIATRPGTKLHAQLDSIGAVVAVARGRYDEAVALIDRAHDVHRRARGYDADVVRLAGLIAVAVDRGGVEDLVAATADTVASTAYARTAGELVAFALLEAGLVDAAAATVADVAEPDVFHDDWTTVSTATAALHVRVGLGDATAAARVRAVVERWSGRWANCGTAALGIGLVDLALARADALLGEPDAARARFAAAASGHERLGTPAWLARTLVHQSRFLATTGRTDDADAGSGAAVRARALATRHGFPYLLAQLDAP